MAKKKLNEKDKLFEEGSIGQVDLRDINTEMQESYLSYAMSVIVARALPDVRDGLKPVHRRILYAMDNVGLRANAKYRKSATVVGEVLGKYHPHGDSAVYDAMVRMAQDFAMRYPLVDGQGNFGSIDGDSAAAMRYTEAKMTKMADELLSDIDKDTVDFVPNYDGSQKEPEVLPSRIPTLLLNGSEGIAVGMATKIPPHNLSELVDGINCLIDNPEAAVEDLMKHVKGPDFPTGGVIYDNGDIKSAYGTGKGGIVMRAVAEIEEEKRGFRIVVSEIPYQVNKASLIEKIADLVKEKKIVGISDIRDESDRKHAVRIVIELKKDAYPNKVLNQLYKLTPMQGSFHMNMIALVNKINPQLLTLKTILEEFIKHRIIVVRRRAEYELRKAKERAHILEGLLIALNHIDEVIATIKKSASQEEAKINLMSKFKLSELQSLAILAMQLRTLAGLERQKIKDEYDALMKRIKELEDLLSSDKKILAVVKDELLEIKEKYGDERRTKIVKQEVGKFNEEDLVPNEQVVLTITSGNYIKRVLSSAYRAQARGGKGVLGMSTKDEDAVDQMAEAMNHDDVLFFTNQGRVFQTKAYEIAASSRIAKGQPIVSLLQLAPEENVTAFVTIPDMTNSEGFLVMATRNGTIKKTAIKQFANIRKTGIIAIGLDKEDELCWVKTTEGKDSIIIVTELSQAIRFNEKEIRPMGRSARGVRGMKLRKGDAVIGMDVVIPNSELVVITENGYGKRTDIEQFTPHHRGGVGIKAGVVTAKTGKTVDIKSITDIKDDLVVISKQGTIIRTPLKNISKIGRATQGVRIMKVADGDTISSIASIPKVKDPEANQELDVPKQGQLKIGEAKKSPKKKEAPKVAKEKIKTAKSMKEFAEEKAKTSKKGSGFTVKKVEQKKKTNPSGFKVKKIK
jgi:DNA gyrase subunit A